MDITEALALVVENKDLSESQMEAIMRQIMAGEATDAQIGGFLVALRMKGETVAEITAAARVMRSLATPVVIDDPQAVDTCGTGGDGANIFNVSTASAFVVAAAGGKVAKHGNRSVSSSTGSADVLEQAGVNLAVPAEHIARAVDTVGVGFMFAQAHHGAMRHVIGARRALKLRTIFNVLGPMTNPAGVKRQVMGVFARELCRPVAEVLKALGSEHVLVVHSADGLDEFSVAAKNYVAELKEGVIREYVVAPTGYEYDDLSGLSVNSAEASLALIRACFSADKSEQVVKARDMIAMNAGAAIYVAGIATDLTEAIEMAEDAIAAGLANQKINELIEFSQLADAHS